MTQEIKQKLGFDASKAISNLNKLAKKLKLVNDGLKKLQKRLNKTGLNKYVKEMKSVSKSTQSGAAKLKRFLQYFTGISPITAAFRVFSSVVKEAVVESTKFGLKIAEVQTIATRMQKSTESLSASVLELSGSYGIPALQVAEGLYQTLSNQVVKASNAIGFLNQSLKLAKVTAAAPADAINALSSVLNVYGSSAGSAAEVSDVLFKTVEFGRLRLNEIANVLGRVLPLTSEMGVNFKEAASAIAVMTRQGVKADIAVTQLRAIMQKIIKPTDEMTKLFHRWGVRDGKDAIRTSGGLYKMLQRMSKEVGNSNAEMAKFFRRVRAITAQLGIMAKNGKLMTSTMAEMEKATGAVNKAWDKFRNSDAQKLTEEWTKFKNDIIKGGQEIAPILTAIIKGFKGMTGFVGRAFRAIDIWINPARKNVYLLSAAIHDASKNIVIDNEVVARSLSDSYKKAARKALQSLQPLQRELFRLTDQIKSAAEDKIGVFNSSLDDAYEKLGGIIQRLDSLVKKADKVRGKSNSKILDINLAADKRQFDDKQKLERFDFKRRKNDEHRLATLTQKLISDSNKLQLSALDQQRNAALNTEARALAAKLKNQAIDEGRRQDAERFMRTESSIDRAQKRSLSNQVALAEKQSLAARKVSDQLKQRQKTVQNISKEIKAQLEAYAESQQRTGPGTRQEQKQIKKNIEEYRKQLESKKLTPEIEAYLKKFDISPGAIKSFNDSIDNAMQNDLHTLLVDLDNLQEQLDSRTFHIKGALKIEKFQRLANNAGIDIQGMGDLEGRQKAIDEAAKLNQANEKSLQLQHEYKKVLDEGLKNYDQIASKEVKIDDLEKLRLGNLQLIKFALIGQTKGVKGQQEYLKSLAQAEVDRRNAANGVTKEYIDEEGRLDAIKRRLEAGQTISQAQLDIESDRIKSSQGYSHTLKTTLSQQLALLNALKLRRDQINNAKKEDPLTDPVRRNAVKQILDESTKQVRVTNEGTAAAQKNYKSREALRKAVLGDLAEQNNQANTTIQQVNKMKGGYDNSKLAVEGVTTAVELGVAPVATLTSAVLKLADAWNQVGKAKSGAGGGAAPPKSRFGNFFAYGGRGTDTIPAVLSKGETVINSRDSSRFFSQLNAMNQGSQPVYREQGGPVTNVGDINVSVNGGDSSQQTVREIGNALRREIQRGTIKLR